MTRTGMALALPGSLALLLALLGAAGLGPPSGGARGTRAVVDVSPSCEPPDPVPGGAILCPDSRLDHALRKAASEGARRILLFTDGCDLSPGPPEPPHIPVDVVLEPRRDDVVALGVRVPDRIPVSTDFAVEVTVGRTRGLAQPPLTVAVTLFRDGEHVGHPTTVRLERGQTARVLVRDRVDREGIVRYRATVEDPLGPKDDDAAGTVARIGEKPLVLSIGGRLEVEGCEVREYDGTAEVSPSSFDVADAIVAHAVPDPVTGRAVAGAVRSGAGLVMIGGRGVAGSEIEKVLPLTDRPPDGRSALLLLDVSGSMVDKKDALIAATKRLLAHFAPDDRVAFVAFRHEPVAASPWTNAAEAHWDLDSLVPQGNTMLEPALVEAQQMLADAKGERRLFVISDGKWGDRESPALRERLAAMGGIQRAALFVADDVPRESKALFPVSLTATDDLGAALERLEDKAKDRTVASADAAATPTPRWLEGAVPPSGTYRDFVRLYPRNVGETIVLAAGEIPLVAAWRPGGKVVMSATAGVDPRALVRAVLKDTGGIHLRAWPEGDEIVAEATGSEGAPFVFDDMAVPARPVAPDRWRATSRRTYGDVLVRCGAAAALVRDRIGGQELQGLGNCPDVAAAIAARSGGRMLKEKGPGEEEAGRRAPGVWATLLLGALLVLASAWRRRRA
jgi:Mg-chelatase subunit ChlD